MTAVNIRAAEALYPVLSVFHSIASLPLQNVWQVHSEGSVDRLILDFNSTSLVISANEDDDSIECSAVNAPFVDEGCRLDVSDREPWKNFIGSSFGWGWVTVNQQGYCDGLLLSFEGIAPQVVLNVIASSLKVGAIVRLPA